MPSHFEALVVESADDEVPVAAASFDLIVSRHPVVTPWSGIARALSPDGTFLSQQVGPGSVGELTEAMIGPYDVGTGRDPQVAVRRGGGRARGGRAVPGDVRAVPHRGPPRHLTDLGTSGRCAGTPSGTGSDEHFAYPTGVSMSSSTHTLLRRAVCLAAAVVVLPVLATPALAASTTVDDGRGDMVRVLEGGAEPTPTPHATVGDFVRTTFRHTARRVVVQARFVDLARTGKRFTMWVDMRDQDRHRTTLGVQSTRRHRAGTAFLMTNHGVDIPCRVTHRIDYRRNTVRASFPRRCVGNPRYLQFSALSEQVRNTWKYAWLDALGRDIGSRAWTGKVRTG